MFALSLIEGHWMTPRDRAIAALSLEEADRVPTFEAWTHIKVIQEILGKKYTGLKEYLEFYQKLQIDIVPVGFGGILAPRILDEKSFQDEFGRRWLRDPEGLPPFTGFYMGGAFATAEEFDSFEFGDPSAPERCVDLSLALNILRKDFLVVGFIDGIFEKCWMPLGGYGKYLPYHYTNPDIVRRWIERAYVFDYEVGREMIDAGAEAILFGDDIADTHGPLVSPKLFERFYYPYYKRLFQGWKKHGAQFVIFHTDGNIYPIIDYLLDAGIDGIDPLDCLAIDIAEFKEKYGDKVCLFGNVDVSVTLPFGTPEDVGKAVRKCIHSAATGGGYVLASSNSLHKGIPATNAVTMFKAARRYGEYPKLRL